MAVANTIDIQEHKGFIKSCQDFPYVFSKIILKESQGFPEVSQDFPCIIWQVWWKIPKILKSKTREDRTSGIQIQYKTEDDTNIENIPHVNAKEDFTKYLSCKTA